MPVEKFKKEELRLLNGLYPKGEPKPGDSIKVVQVTRASSRGARGALHDGAPYPRVGRALIQGTDHVNLARFECRARRYARVTPHGKRGCGHDRQDGDDLRAHR